MPSWCSATSLICGLLAVGLSLAIAGRIIAADDAGEFRGDDWIYTSPAKPAVPQVDHGQWVVNPIDAFIVRELDTAGLAPNPRADKHVLLRRVTYDLIGLPPTAHEQQRFLEDDAPDAYLRLVERLLASPGFGERWAQHWLDVVRFAETEGFKADRLRPNAFRYRDYVIDSFNADRPYDEFVRQQLAGDQLDALNPEALVATGFIRLYPDENNAANLFQRRQEILNEVTEVTSVAFMGLTMGCARCHDHKFDAIPQADFYRLQAFFAPIMERDDLPAAGPDAVARYQSRFAAWNEATQSIRREMDELLADVRSSSDRFSLSKFREEIKKCVRTPEADRTPLERQIAAMAAKQLDSSFDLDVALRKLGEDQQTRYRELVEQLQSFDDLRPAALPAAMAVSDVGEVHPETHVLDGGDWRSPLEPVDPGFPTALCSDELAGNGGPDTSAAIKRRADLARWLTRKQHPLTARVIVNRLWQHHFGRGIVATPNDFGIMGDPPTHPELLDWLAVELVEHDWSLKHVHRLMVTSAAYCQSSELPADQDLAQRAQRVDPQNRLLCRANRRRLEGEVLRDSMLSLAGVLNRQMHGASSRPQLPDGLSERYTWKPGPLHSQHRRSVYVLAKRNLRFPLFEAFDLPDMHASCGCRPETITAPQALLLLNSDLTRGHARRWAAQLIAASGDDLPGLIREAYKAAFGRDADDDDLVLARAFFDRHEALTRPAQDVEPPADVPSPADTEHAADAGDAGAPVAEQTSEQTDGSQLPPADDESLRLETVADFCHALLNANEFIYVD